MIWKILNSGRQEPQVLMDLDKSLLQDIANLDQPILHFYDWKGLSATYGYFINPLNYLDGTGVDRIGLKLGRRPTGGGIVFHLTDLAFSVLVPASHPCYSTNTLENYAFVNKCVAKVIRHLKKEIEPVLLPIDAVSMDEDSQKFCMAKPTIFDVMVEGKKIGGAAQRRTREGFLHQGTISLCLPPEHVLRMVLKPDTNVLKAMKFHSYALMDCVISEQDLHEVRQTIRHLLFEELKKIA